MNLKIANLNMNGGTQPRESINPDVVREYAEDRQNGSKFPPVTVYYDGTSYWLADGFHRVEAAKFVGATAIEAEIHQGSRRDAILHSVGANADHGLRRTNADKRRAVTALLNDDEWSQWSDREIARRCAVNDKTVAKIRAELTADFRSEKPTERTYTTKHGTTAKMNTGNIGKRENVTAGPSEWFEPGFEEYEKPEDTDNDPGYEYTSADAISDLEFEVDRLLSRLDTNAQRHHVVNELIKKLRSLSIEYNRGTV